MDDRDTFSKDLISMIPHMRAFARSLCSGNTAEADDLAQEALTKAWAARSSFTPGTNLKAWTFMIVRNQFYSDKRRSWRSQPLDPEVAERTLSFSPNGAAALELEDLRRALAMLSRDQREALILVAAGEFSYEDAAAILDVKIGTVKSRVSRARDALEAILAEDDLVPEAVNPAFAMANILAQVSALRDRHVRTPA